ncbi:hydrogenase maturation protease [Nostocoides sp. F2B08]|uniref:hydrogenase maturation protease n=1 Tax=Nostocoides sp. F2B08 TaxID=2653936 RepID=UPI00186B315C|nr:hydrogenase maturation protease [Tetrasphaera sp. F2B08]
MTLVIGLGHPDRGDDAVGPVVTGLLTPQAPPGVEMLEREDPMDLVLHWGGQPWVVVIDAVVSGARPGTVTVTEIAEDGCGARDWSRLALGGTHAFGLGEAVELSRTLGRLPARLTLVGVEAGDVAEGRGLTAAVAAAVPEAVALVRRLLVSDATEVGRESRAVDVPR